MSSAPKLRRLQVGGLPLIRTMMQQIGLRELLTEALPAGASETVATADTLLLLAINLTLAKDPLYALAEWVDGLDLHCLGYRERPTVRFTDDRFARALDQLYQIDRATLLTQLVVRVVQRCQLDLSRIHNDCTTVKAYGQIPGRTRQGFELRHGYSKDHRPDLKQLVFCLSICADGAVPVHHNVYSGNRNEDTTHCTTWEILCQIHGCPNFLYVADCKLCTQPQLQYLVERGGRAITSVPQNWLEVQEFQESLRAASIPKKLLWRRPQPADPTRTEYFSLFAGRYQTRQGKYPIYWFCSSAKRRRDRTVRAQRLQAAEAALAELSLRINRAHLKTKPSIERAAAAIVGDHQLKRFLDVRAIKQCQHWRRRGPGRPGKLPLYRNHFTVSYRLAWPRQREALRRETRLDGLFPLLCTDPAVTPKQVLQAYKYQPRLEKRFEQFKTVHRAAPLLFKRIDRLEANLFVFFIALLLQALLERALRQQLKKRRGPPLKLYPEERDALHPTTSQLLKTFDGLSTYVVTQDGNRLAEYRDELTETHRAVLALFEMEEEGFWKPV